MFSIQKVELAVMATAFGPVFCPAKGVPCKKAVFAVPPPTIGAAGSVETSSVTVLEMVWFLRVSFKMEFGLSIMACVIPTSWAGGERKSVGVLKLASGNVTRFVGLPIRKGVMLLS